MESCLGAGEAAKAWQNARRIMKKLALVAPLVVAALVAACSATVRDNGFPPDADGGTLGNGGGDGGGGLVGNGPFDSSAGDPCAPNPANAEIPGNNCDDDADGTVDNAPTCDTGLAKNGNATDFAKALGICADASTRGYGLVSATYTRGYNRNTAPRNGQTGILPKFGNVLKPREGAQLAAISTGWAREYNQDTGTSQTFLENGAIWDTLGSTGAAPPGFPKPAAGCPIDSNVFDVVGVKLTLKAPPNAKGISFDFNFHTSEWPIYVCSEFNDGFIAYLTSKAFNGGKGDNISFDSQKNPVSVNNGFFDRCTDNVTIGCFEGSTSKRSSCPGGPGELAGTGFGKVDAWCNKPAGPGAPPFSSSTTQSTAGGATGWLTSTAPVEPGETFTLEFMIWDTGDPDLDSLTLLDNFRWVQGETKTETARPR